MGAYNSDPIVNTLSSLSGTFTKDVIGKIYSKLLQTGMETTDDFAKMTGAAKSSKPFWKQVDLSAKKGNDRIVFTTMGGAAGPGARGDQELTGRTSVPRLGAYSLQVDFFRDAVELTKKDQAFLAAGEDVQGTCVKMVGEKMGRKRMYDMMHALIRTPNALFLRPNNRASQAVLRQTDTLSTTLIVDGKARLQSRGGRPIEARASNVQGGAPLWRYMVFAGQDAMVDIRNESAYQNAQLQAAPRHISDNPLFSSALPDWQGCLFWEHVVIDPDTNDAIGSPIAPKAVLGEAVSAGTVTFVLKGGDGTSTLCEYFRDFPGYDYKFTEDQSAAPDGSSYYFWILNITGADAGKACFYRYTGSANTGNQITAVTQRLGASASGIRADTVGNVTYAEINGVQGKFTADHPVGSVIIPANAWGVPIARNFIFGAGAALRGVGQEDIVIKQDRDYGWVKGAGYEGVWGQRAALDTQSVPRHYVVLESAYQHPGLEVPEMPIV